MATNQVFIFLWVECMFQNNNVIYHSQCPFTAHGGSPFCSTSPFCPAFPYNATHIV